MELSRSELELESIVRRIQNGELDLQPDFQRGEIWDNKRRQRLIDSLLREWYVPAIHIVRDRNGGPETVLDGQQRLAAIRDFFQDAFTVDGNTEPADDDIRSLDGLTYSRLPDKTRRALQRFALPCVILREYAPQEPNELFFRLNQSYNLTPSEKRNALHGKARLQVKTVVEELTAAELLDREVIGFSNGRLAYDDIVARTCLALERGNLKMHINNNVVEAFYREREFSNNTTQAVLDAGRALSVQCRDAGGRLRFNKATLFSWLVFCSWAPTVLGGPLPAGLLADFERQRQALKRNELMNGPAAALVGPVSLYDDRASYRVTDVSSVLARDCVLYLYLQEHHNVPSVLGSYELAYELREVSESRAQQLILDFVTEGDWGVISAHEAMS